MVGFPFTRSSTGDGSPRTPDRRSARAQIALTHQPAFWLAKVICLR